MVRHTYVLDRMCSVRAHPSGNVKVALVIGCESVDALKPYPDEE